MTGRWGRAESRMGQGRCRGEGLCYRSIMMLRLGERLGARMLKSSCRMCCEDVLLMAVLIAHGWRCGGWLLHVMQTTRA